MTAAFEADAADRYVAEYLDGPLAGRTEHRVLIDGAPEPEISQVALLEGTDGLFWYLAGDQKSVNGELQVHYRFDPRDSDPLEGAADPDDESLNI